MTAPDPAGDTVTFDPAPGTRVEFNTSCPWPELVGVTGTVVEASTDRLKMIQSKGDNRRVLVLIDGDTGDHSRAPFARWLNIARPPVMCGPGADYAREAHG